MFWGPRYLVLSQYYSPLILYSPVESEILSEMAKSNEKYEVVDGGGNEILKH